MKIAKIAIAAAVCTLLTGTGARAQQASSQSSVPGRLSAYTKYYSQEPPSPSDDKANEKPLEQEPGIAPPQYTGPTEEAEEPTSCYSEKYEPVRLFGKTSFEKKWGIQNIGWVAQSYTQNFYSPTNRYNGPVDWTDRSNDYEMNEFYNILKRDVDNGGEGWDWGFRWDNMYGTSAKYCTSSGFEDKFQSNTQQSMYNDAMPSAQIVGQYNDMKVTMGRFISPVGFYTIGTYLNFFNTIPYTYQYGEPFTHTGFLAQQQVTDDLNLGLGVTRGWDNTGNFNPNAGVLGTVTRNNLSKEGDSLAWVFMYSNEPQAVGVNSAIPINPGVPYNPPGFAGRYFQTLVYSRPITDRITYIAQSDFGHQTNAFGDGRAALWYGLNQYIYYKVNNCWSWGIEGEWFRDEEGFRVGGFLPNFTSAQQAPGINPHALPTSVSGFAGNFFQTTMGPRWTPNPNLVIRPNMRWDWYDGPANGLGLAPYGNGNHYQQGILGTDVVVVY
ncbi:MAG TPA: outer membrane beta-barrel protein [Pirellulales bacterium]|nr:outer membrane beta-barrel protein [Pirellulales bacterium]